MSKKNKTITVKNVKDYFDSHVQLKYYDLEGCEITEDDFCVIRDKVANEEISLEDAVDEYLRSIREVLDEALEEYLQED